MQEADLYARLGIARNADEKEHSAELQYPFIQHLLDSTGKGRVSRSYLS